MQPIPRLLLLSAALRAALIAWGVVQDTYLQVKYTDVDYNVFTDAARFVVAGESPFLRSTYRYSPLLAYVVLPNILVTSIWGKLVFAAGDILAAWQIARLCRLQRVPERTTWWCLVAWLYNPFTITISTRGSCDVLVANMLLAVLILLFRGQLLAPALLYGLAVHFRIYPIIYAPAIVLFLAQRALQQRGKAQAAPWPVALVSQTIQQGAAFGALSGGVFVALGAGFYKLYGQLFLQEAFLHHLGRKDPRHNFSLYFYHVYLTFTDWAAAAGGGGGSSSSGGGGGGGGDAAAAAAWLPDPARYAFALQAVLLLAAAAALHRHLPFCWLVQTMIFVAFNKVSTAQYFVWYYSLLPLVLPFLPWPPPRPLAVALGAWVLTQLHWLAWAYLLEFQGWGVYLPLWGASCLFLVANAGLMAALLRVYSPTRSFLGLSLEGGQGHKQA